MSVRCREAESGDAGWVYSVNNHPTVRARSLSAEPIPWAHHEEWFAAVAEDRDRVLWIGTDSGCDFGVIRFDIEGEHAEISVAVAPAAQGHGLGTALIASGSAKLFDTRSQVATILAQVKTTNSASLAAFGRCGFTATNPGAEVVELLLRRSTGEDGR